MNLQKVSEFIAAFIGKTEAFTDTLDTLLTNEEGNTKITDFLKAHFPAAMTWESELHAAVLIVKKFEGAAAPEIEAVLSFLAALTPKAA